MTPGASVNLCDRWRHAWTRLTHVVVALIGLISLFTSFCMIRFKIKVKMPSRLSTRSRVFARPIPVNLFMLGSRATTVKSTTSRRFIQKTLYWQFLSSSLQLYCQRWCLTTSPSTSARRMPSYRGTPKSVCQNSTHLCFDRLRTRMWMRSVVDGSKRGKGQVPP